MNHNTTLFCLFGEKNSAAGYQLVVMSYDTCGCPIYIDRNPLIQL